ncbi:DinB family protein [Saccharibacillus kuerlensis]|uniref:Formate dehydrogenase n=1 Tax=Saccharibacillus kuerlensis TaxID=459527 RepID=A0ABQ2L3Y3_9BACL|nr:DinB family protein [Saccharibacillus kuerlensis]GGO01642.1 formate dehydrogenase [Saccharibacillus kuerlensis]
MTEAFVFKLMDRAQASILKYLEDVPEEARKTIPEGFNNNLHWQLGHILAISDRVVNTFSGRELVFPETYAVYFAARTKPAEWQGEPPAWDELIGELEQLPARFREAYADKLDEPLANLDNFAKAETLGDLLTLNVAHMNQHMGIINALTRITRR